MNNTTDDDLAPRRDHESNAEFARRMIGSAPGVVAHNDATSHAEFLRAAQLEVVEGGVPARDLRTFAALDTAESLRSIAESLRVVAGWAVWQMNNR